MDKIVIRPSSLSTWMHCPWKWWEHNVIGKPMIPNIKMIAGTATHKGAEVGYAEKIKSDVLPPVSVMEDAAVEEFHTRIKEEEARVEEDEDIQIYESIVRKNILLYNPIMEQTTPVAVEKFYRLPVESPAVEALQGTADIVATRSIIDIKTTLRKAVPKNYQLQISAYALLAESVEEEAFTFAKIHNIINGREAIEMPVRLEKERTWYLLQNLIKAVEAVFEGGVDPELVFRGNPTSILCSEKYCDGYKTCPFVKGGKK